ncbi:DUF3833 domain-containing protein [Tolumonas osonensis]|uniref:DUF3833 domain-containing protein n=1 Tax=Tolumonas osonensis TaxID=675874 RepID=A0A841GH49_9GAMM|nr:DUF3833 domain-containing protein [Tolumonas osonensis]MBB6054675.1 hypothetical protein [Tolumonas osonensis]
MKLIHNVCRVSGTILIACGSLLAGCSQTTEDYANTQPQIDVQQFFSGPLKAYGLVKDYSGKVTERFHVDMSGTWTKDATGTLIEHFVYADGRKEQRTWYLQKAGNYYIGTAADIDGEAIGNQQGFTLNWHYRMNLKLKDGSTVKVKFNDWMYLLDERRLINHAEITKFGFKVGEVVLYIEKI